VARTAWLIVFCLLGLGPFICVKVVMSTTMPMVAADAVDAALPPAKQSVQQDTLGKVDRLPTFQQTESKQRPALSLAAVVPAETVQAPLPDSPKFVGRHWHETSSLSAINRRPKSRPGIKQHDTTAVSSARGLHCADGNDMLKTLTHMTACRSTLAASGNPPSN
jgi:hypothetical protein